jgi:hypothetical protein
MSNDIELSSRRKKLLPIEEFEKHECTFLEYGDTPVKIQGYYCESCDPEKAYLICITCLNDCHKNCLKSRDLQPKDEDYICHCGKIQKHEINVVKEKATSCDIYPYDEKTKNNTIYSCRTCNKSNICSICYYQCHHHCDKSISESLDYASKTYSCDCTDERHALNGFVFNLEHFKLGTQKFDFHTHIQILNSLFEGNAMDKFVGFIERCFVGLDNEDLPKVESERLYNIIYDVAVYTFDYSYRKAYYFNDRFLKCFDFEFLSKHILNINIPAFDRQLDEDKEIRHIYFIYLIFYLHMKKDFNNIKKYSIYDYLSSTLSERLKLRALLYSDITAPLQKKYNIYKPNGEQGNSLAKLTLKVAELLTTKTLANKDFFSVKVMILRFIYFSLKKMIFDMTDLIKLMKILERSYETIFHNYENDLELFSISSAIEKEVHLDTFLEKNDKYKNKKLPNLIDLPHSPSVISYFNKILYLVTITYNDLVTMNLLEERDTDKKYKEFIHTYSEHGENFLEMLLKNCRYFSQNFELPYSIISTKILIVFNENLRMFTMTDNAYFLNLKKAVKLGLSDLKDYEKTIDEVTGSGSKKGILEVFFKTGVNTLVENLGKNIENEIKSFFHIDSSGIWERVIKYFSDFSKAYQLLLNNVSIDDNIEENEKHIKYHKKILTYTEELILFVKHTKFKLMFPVFVNILTFSNMDEILTRLLQFTNLLKTPESEKIIDLVVGFLSLLCLTKEGLAYLFKGKNLMRVIAIFKSKESRILEFLYLIFKGANLYKIDIAYNKVIPEATKIIFKYIINKQLNTDSDKIELIHVMRIFSLIARYFDFEEYKKVKGEILLYLNKNGYITSEKFKTCFTMGDNSDEDIEELEERIKEAIDARNAGENNHRLTDQNLFRTKTIEVKRKNSDSKLIEGEDKDSELDKEYEMKLNINKRVSVGSKKVYRQGTTIGFNRKMLQNQNSVRRNNDSETLDQIIYFSFFKLITNKTFYVFEKEKFRDILLQLIQLNDLDYFEKVLKKRSLTLRQRSTLLKYLLSFYLMDILNEQDIHNEAVYLTTEEFQRYLTLKSRGERISKRLEREYQWMLNFEKIIKIYINELDTMVYWAFYDLSNLKEIEKYYAFMVLAVKFISDYFFNERNELSNHMTLHFYKLAYKFISKYESIKQVLMCIKKLQNESVQNCLINAYLNRNKENEIQGKMKDYNFNFFDTNNIYYIVLNAINDINNEVRLDKKFRLEKVLYSYDKRVSLNFFSVGLLFDGEYENFYEEYDDITKEPELNEEQARLKPIFDNYMAKFIDIRNTCFLAVIGNISTEDVTNYRELLVNYFRTYITCKKHVDENFDMSIISIITKTLFFDVRKMQDTFEMALQDDQFFINFHSKFQKITVLSYTTAKNFFMYKRFSRYINMKAKLMLQFLQLLGEGFNKGFHQKILYPIETDKLPSQLFYDEELMYDKKRYRFKLYTDYKSSEQKMLETKSVWKPVEKKKKGGKKKGKFKFDFTFKEEPLETEAGIEEEDEEDDAVREMRKNSMDPNFVASNLISSVNQLVAPENPGATATTFNKKKIFFYEYIFQQMILASDFITMNAPVSFELPNDNLIVLFSNIISFLIEYNGNCEVDTHNEVLRNYYKIIFEITSSLLFNRGEGFSEKRKQILLYMKISYMKLLISIVHNGEFGEVQGAPLNLLTKMIGLTSLFEEIIFYLNELITIYKSKEKGHKLGKNVKLSDESIVDKFIDLYVEDMDFEESYELEFSLIVFRYIKVMSEIYKLNGIEKYFEDNAQFLITMGNKSKNSDTSFYSLSSYRAYQFLSKLVLKVDIRIDTERKRFNFFVKPPMTFLLSENTKQKFLDEVDRSSAFTKLGALIDKSDYFIFEMFHNYNLATQGKVNITLKSFRMDQLEAVNFFFVVLHQIFLFIYFNAPPEPLNTADPRQFTDDQKYVINTGNFIVAIIQIVFIGLVLLIWAYYFFPLFYQRLLMKERKVKFLIRTEKEANQSRNVVRFTDNFVEDNKELLSSLNDSVSFLDKCYLFIRYGILFNTDLNVFLLNFGLLIGYLSSKNSLLIVIPVLFLSNLSALLSDIILTIKMRWKQLILVIIFTYLLVYFFSWVSFLYMYHVFDTDAYSTQSDPNDPTSTVYIN